ncbi:cell division protein FtsZ [Candidatus Woesearchaeota archaeon]|jgi:cell division protein FtsZ|nr:cell division protein FtsZ [Candidatus Woesearchaeota archaeon]MBT4114491.1 cell division protein FtsZ [Candidatus Woesearchaeota archaeon]MBT4248179.1 cell division protein FtsZ [Candidatus Woesearchaeota archaeon]
MEFVVQNAIKTSEGQKTTYDGLIGQATIKVIGAGGGGNNMVDWLYKKGVSGAEIISINTDKQHLDFREADKKILIGRDLTKGLGAGGNPAVGTESAREQIHEVKESIRGADMLFLTAGLGGGTGTGAIPVIAQAAKEMGCIVICVVTMPFTIEKARIDKAEWGLKQLRQCCDTVIVIDNNRLATIAGNLPIQQAFAVANELISTMIKGIVEIIAVPSLINMDFADVKTIMSKGDVSVIGIGEADDEKRAITAVKRALSNPLLDVDYKGANGALIHITGGADLTLDEAEQVGKLVTDNLDADAMVMWGARIEDDMQGKIRVMTIITGVKSPFVLGKAAQGRASEKTIEMNSELGIDMIR